MMVLDTHIFIWWLNCEPQLKQRFVEAIDQATAVSISAISLWEFAKLVEYGRLIIDRPALDWINAAVSHPKIQVVPLTPEIIFQSTQLPGDFHRDPADQLIVATAMVLDAPLMTLDGKILGYPHVKLFV